jgi:hypothetical protein
VARAGASDVTFKDFELTSAPAVARAGASDVTFKDFELTLAAIAVAESTAGFAGGGSTAEEET